MFYDSQTLSNMVKLGLIQLEIIKLGQKWSNMFNYGQTWWNNMVKVGQTRSNMIKLDQKGAK